MNQANDYPLNRFLSAKYPPHFLTHALVPREQWHPYPVAADRADWVALPETIRRARIAHGEAALKQLWPHLPASVYLQFARIGNRSHYETPYFLRRDILGHFVIAECMEGKGRFIEPIVDAIWSICEESSWCVPAHISAQAAGCDLPETREPVVDLFAAETAGLLAWCGYLFGPALDLVSPLIMERLHREVDARLLTPALGRDDFWWMGFTARKVNNWNPWINSNWLTTILLCERNEARRQAAVYRVLESLDRFITPYPRDGGCDEGPSYWGRAGASLFDCLELLYSATDGKIDVYAEPHIQEIGRYIYRAHIAGDYYVNFADAPARLRPEPGVVYRFGKRIGDVDMLRFGAWLAQGENLSNQGWKSRKELSAEPGRVLPSLFALAGILAVEPRPPLLRDTWLGAIQVMAARDQAGTSQGFYVAAKGGHNDESHNHNDVGHYIVYIDGKPVIVDAGVETYTRKTFSPQRYEIWTMQSAYHSLPTIDGVMQLAGREYAARDVRCQAEAELAQISMDISAAYPPEARLSRWLRTVTLHRGQSIEVIDDFVLKSAVNQITLSMITPCFVDKKAPGQLILSEAPLASGRVSGAGQVAFDASCLTVTCEEIHLTDERLGSVWGKRLTRILFRMEAPPLAGRLLFQITH